MQRKWVKIDVLEDTQLKYPEDTEVNKINYCASKSTTVVSNLWHHQNKILSSSRCNSQPLTIPPSNFTEGFDEYYTNYGQQGPFYDSEFLEFPKGFDEDTLPNVVPLDADDGVQTNISTFFTRSLVQCNTKL